MITEIEQAMIDAPEEDYMNQAQLDFFQQRLEDLYDTTCERIEEARKVMENPIELNDEQDRASFEEQSALSIRIVEREQKLLPKIRESLSRIKAGTYGYCLESEEPIGVARLLARPTAEYCAEVKALKEMKELQYRE